MTLARIERERLLDASVQLGGRFREEMLAAEPAWRVTRVFAKGALFGVELESRQLALRVGQLALENGLLVAVIKRRSSRLRRCARVDLRLTVSGGVAMWPMDASTAFDLAQMAESACRKAKQAGRNRCLMAASGFEEILHVPLSPARAAALEARSVRTGVPLQVLLRDAVQLVLQRHAGHERFCAGVVERAAYRSCYGSLSFRACVQTWYPEAEPRVIEDSYRAMQGAYPYLAISDFSAIQRALRRRGIRVGVLTNGPRRLLSAKLAAAHCDPMLVDFALGAEDLPAPKPSSTCFDPVLECTGLAPSAHVYVGESADDLKAAAGRDLGSSPCARGHAPGGPATRN